jgi:putative ABC transport system permease protein
VKLWRSGTDLRDEVDGFFEDAIAHWMAEGLSEEEARRRAQLQFGSRMAVRETVRSSGWEHIVDTVSADVRYALRRLRRDRSVTMVSVLTLALGIGVTTAIFSVVYAVLFAPLPYPHPERVVMVWDTAQDGSAFDVTFGTYRELLARSHAFDAAAVMRPWQPTLTGDVEPERLNGQRVGARYFEALGVRPAIGTGFDLSDDRPNAPRVVIVSHRLWQRRFAADAQIVGHTITLDETTFVVRGVMPEAFENVLAPTADVWTTLQYDPALPTGGREWGHHLRMVARLSSGVGTDSADRELDAIAQTRLSDFARPPWAALTRGLIVRSLDDEITHHVRPGLLAVLGAVMLVLAIACVNVTNVLLARGVQRRGEFAMRTALGAPRSRLIRQLVTESLMLAAVGGLCGVALAPIGVKALVALGPTILTRAHIAGVDGTVLLFAVCITGIAGVTVGLSPALYASRDLRVGLPANSPRLTGGHQFARRSFVISEVAIAIVLLVATGLLLRSVQRLFAIAPGFEPNNLLVMQVQTAGQRFNDDAHTRAFFAQALDAVLRVPGVVAAAFTSQLPLSGDADLYGVQFESAPPTAADQSDAFRYAIRGDYFTAMRIPLKRGRLLDARDTEAAAGVVVINESLAKRRFPDRDPIGQRVRVGSAERPWQTVVGVVGDVKQSSLAADRMEAAYVAAAQWYAPDRAMWLVVRTEGQAAALTAPIRSAIWSVDRNQPIVRATTMNELVMASEATRRFAVVLFEAFGIAALALAAIGIYGVLFAGVSERTREIGVRAALGASRSAIVAEVVREGMTLTAVGVVIGAGFALVTSRALTTLLFGISHVDAMTYVSVAILLFAASLLASSIPALRASWVDPAITLRAE